MKDEKKPEQLVAAAPGAAAAPDAQPVEFPVTHAEWEASRPAHERILLAGFRFALRQSSGLTATKLAAEWTKDFATFQQTPV